MAGGIVKRHTEGCAGAEGGKCGCRAGYEAWVYSPRDRKKVRRTSSNYAEARSWRADAKRQIDQGSLRAPAQQTLYEAATAWLAGAERGEFRNRSGAPYKPSTLRGYRQALEERILPLIGGEKLSAITTYDLQLLVDRWAAEDQSAATLRNTIKPLQAIYRRAKSRGGLPVNPTQDLELPAPRARKVEIVAPEVAAELLAALPADDQVVWGTALYAGLRYGELRALRWRAVDFVAGTIGVHESWDPKAGSIDPKTETSVRTVPMPDRCGGCSWIDAWMRRVRPAMRSPSASQTASRFTQRRCIDGPTRLGWLKVWRNGYVCIRRGTRMRRS
jgi:integrase